jgi:hypothetical protein
MCPYCEYLRGEVRDLKLRNEAMINLLVRSVRQDVILNLLPRVAENLSFIAVYEHSITGCAEFPDVFGELPEAANFWL